MKKIERNIFQIGVDHLIIKNITIEYPEHLKKMTLTEDGGLQEGITERGEGFIIYSFTKLTKDNELIPFVNTLVFNPNKILDGNNLMNSKAGRIYDALVKVKNILDQKNIKLDYSESTVETTEININLNIEFVKLKKVLDLMFYVMSKGKSKCTFGDDNNYISRNRRKVESFWFRKNENVFRAYNKTLELLEKEKIDINLEVTRIEDKLSPYNFKKIFKDNNLDLKLMTVLKNFDLIEISFKKRWALILKESLQYLDANHAKEIAIEYKKFKDTQKLARERKKIDQNIKLQCGVYKYLYDNFSIFDKKYIFDVIDNYHNRNFKREKQMAEKYFSNENGINLIKFLADFFCTTFSKPVQEN
ncbi:hypothetical protein SAMN02745174_02271 [Cetobacterium ceti]|uniref:Uncharacterized protein n=1 Tax=Cetobacterium ceti TaxID=180163 RepID=A0A1T4QCR6_9FUSO|nr:hypothetical protein [Cetobacterium ceti]SKA01406.1 hypothetical protein SAMN02745174_02271 [Cetobacterium ceti]